MLRFPPKKILVPFDLSDLSMAAWNQAKDLSRRFGSALETVYIEEPVPLIDAGLYVPMDKAELKRKTLRHVRSKIGISRKILYIEGKPAAVILRLARARGPDLIVMGTHGRTGIERIWEGSVTEAVVRSSAAPVLTLRGEPSEIRSVLAPVNFTDYSGYGLAFAADVAAALKVPLTLMHVGVDPRSCPNPRLKMNLMLDRLPKEAVDACRPSLDIRFGSPTEEILKASQKHGLVILVARQKSLLADVVLGTTAERVIRHCRAPVLAVPAPKGKRQSG